MEENKEENKTQETIDNSQIENNNLSEENQVKNEINIDYKDMALRAMADLQNYRKRSEEENRSHKEYLVFDVISEFLPIFNNLKKAEMYIPEDQKTVKWVIGITMIINQFKEILKMYGVEEFSVIDQKFDHETMDAVMTEKDETKEDDFILREVDCGYKLNGKIVQHAKVVVNKLN